MLILEEYASLRFQQSKPGENASAGNRARVTSMATMYSTTRPLMLLQSNLHKPRGPRRAKTFEDCQCVCKGRQNRGEVWGVEF